jgi:tetratricopeptide (TPR) repeat protein
VTARGEMRDLISVFDSLAWKLTRQLDPGFSVAEETFVAAGKGLRLDAFEQYIRGITEPDQAERLRHLKQAVLLNPDFSQAWMALGREDYNGQQYEQAAAAFAKVGASDPDALEAGFYRGCRCCFPATTQGRGGIWRRGARSAAGRGLNNQGLQSAARATTALRSFVRPWPPTPTPPTTTSTWR